MLKLCCVALAGLVFLLVPFPRYLWLYPLAPIIMTAADDTSAHSGDEKLVFAIDLGTTQTAVSFVHLQPGLAPRVKLVTRWPGQEDASGDCKVRGAI